MSYADSVLVDDEVVLYRGRIHWAIYLLELLVAVLGIAWIIALKQKPFLDQFLIAWHLEQPHLLLPAYVLIAGSFAALVRDYIRKLTTELVITNSRVIAKFGVIRRVTYEILLSKVEGANIQVTILGRLLGYGSIEVKGIGGRTAPIPYVASPFLFQRNLMKHLLQMQEEDEDTDTDPQPRRNVKRRR